MKTNLQFISPIPAVCAGAHASNANAVAGPNGNGPLQRTGGPLGIRVLFHAVLLAGALALHAQENGEAAAPDPVPSATVATNPAPPAPAPAAAEAPPAAASTAAIENPAALADSGATNGLRLNFRNAPIDLVLNYLSEAAGFIIELDTRVSGTVSVISSHPMTKDEAVDLVNSVLNKNGYAAIRTGERTLKIMDKSTARSSNNPVKVGNDPVLIPNNDEMVTQIIPIRFVEATSLVADLSPFVSSDARIIANEAGNSIVITDTQANIRHIVEIIKAIDSSAEDVTVMRAFHLDHADPSEMATLLTGLFPDSNNSAQSPMRFSGSRGSRGGGGGPAAFFAAMAGRGGNSGNQSDRIKKRTQVVAVADARTSSVVVTATQNIMEQIEVMIEQLDRPGKAQRMEVIRIHNADPNEVLSVLQDTVGATTSRNSRSSQNSPFQSRIQQNQNTSRTGSSSFGSGTSRTGGSSRTGGGF